MRTQYTCEHCGQFSDVGSVVGSQLREVARQKAPFFDAAANEKRGAEDALFSSWHAVLRAGGVEVALAYWAAMVERYPGLKPMPVPEESVDDV